MKRKGILVLNDQGGAVMAVSYDITSTLRAQMGGHLPIVLLFNGKADGADGGGVSFAIVGDHENRSTDMTNLVVIYEDSDREKIL